MKTFMLKKLHIMKTDNHDGKDIALIDGLIINREDNDNYWLIEAYIEKSYKDFFQKLKENEEELLLEVKISKENNKPAMFTTHIIEINDIGENMNVLFKGIIVEKS
ncbi:hypothetical protein D8M04_09905 [Oceanobacillus piezotolerans]|uniref:Uncharacterized protein n=1 Tax=Oceanobacillus piezotolerans TaxID=2448030 RepID=A0A498DI35_9BACI|nr:YwpF family protein [Oceanobacillus piezotolerans]RLL45165.1 hypothetical protein D8M04_09905 [Oceanobacillus piezotolerans]